MQGLLLICLCPFNIIYRSSRFFLIRSLFRCICSPFYKVIDSTALECAWWATSYVDSLYMQVKMVDFFLADQLTSQVSYFIEISIGDMDLVFHQFMDFWPFFYICLTSDTSHKKYCLLHLLLWLGKSVVSGTKNVPH